MADLPASVVPSEDTHDVPTDTVSVDAAPPENSFMSDEMIEQINQFWEEHNYDERLQHALHMAHIENECQRGVMRYKNGRNLKDGLEIIDHANRAAFNPREVHAQLLSRPLAK